jgi:hypothetical protein
MHPAALPLSELAKQCDESRTKRGGPGGQHRNKVETAVVLVHTPTGISAEGSERRSQAENRTVAFNRLRMKLAVEHREPTSVQPSQMWQQRVRGRQLVISASHPDLPALVSEALDHLHDAQWQVSKAAETLGISSTQLIGLCKKAPAAWVAVNKRRLALGMPALK